MTFMAPGHEGVTPGRIGSVFFFPSHRIEVLENKEPGWGRKTDYGRWESWFPE